MVNTAAVSIVVVFMQVAQVTEEDKRLLEEGGEDDEPPVGVDFVTFMMHAGKMDLETIATNAVDLMAGGVDTVKPRVRLPVVSYWGSRGVGVGRMVTISLR